MLWDTTMLDDIIAVFVFAFMVVVIEFLFGFHHYWTAESLCLIDVIVASRGLCYVTRTIKLLRKMRIVFIFFVFTRTSALEDISEELGDCK